MFLAYFDEFGDDGYPVTSSELFVLTSIYMHEAVWKQNHDKIHRFRAWLKNEFGMPVKQEFHTKEFVTDKSPYHNLYTPIQRLQILEHYCSMISTLEIKCISVVIDKGCINRDEYNVLKNALTYNVQRIENDLDQLGKDNRFIIITDDGRVSKMKHTTRAIQKINYIPSQFSSTAYRKEIKNLIEDPFSKDSQDSYFIQIADLISFIVSLYAKQNLCSTKIEWGKRIKNVIDYNKEIELLNRLVKVLNTKASWKNPFGIVCYPTKK